VKFIDDDDCYDYYYYYIKVRILCVFLQSAENPPLAPVQSCDLQKQSSSRPSSSSSSLSIPSDNKPGCSQPSDAKRKLPDWMATASQPNVETKKKLKQSKLFS